MGALEVHRIRISEAKETLEIMQSNFSQSTQIFYRIFSIQGHINNFKIHRICVCVHISICAHTHTHIYTKNAKKRPWRRNSS